MGYLLAEIHQRIFIRSLVYFMNIAQIIQNSIILITLCSEFTNHDLMGNTALSSFVLYWGFSATYWREQLEKQNINS